MSKFDPTIEDEEEDDEFEVNESENILKGMVENLNELPTDVLQQLLDNLNEIEAYNKAHPEELESDDEE